MFRTLADKLGSVKTVDPANLNLKTTPYLRALLKQHSGKAFFDAEDIHTHKKQVYKVTMPGSTKSVNVHLKKPMVRYTRKNDPNQLRYAVCERKPLGDGGEGVAYLSKGSIVVDQGSDVGVTYKVKNDNKSRVVKVMRQRCDEKGQPLRLKDGALFDGRTQKDKAEREYGFLVRDAFFHVKKPVISADGKRAALFMRCAPGEEFIEIMLRDQGDVDGKQYGDIFNVKQRLDLAIMAAEAILNQVHANAMIHRDIRPENIMVLLDEDNNPVSVRVVDFGLSKVKDEKNIDDVVGTTEYQAPEVLNLTIASDEKSDSYALAIMLRNSIFNWLDSDRFADLSSEQLQKIRRLLESALEEDHAKRMGLPEFIGGLKQVRDSLRNTKAAGYKA